MKLALLGGNNPNNEAWVESIQRDVDRYFDHTEVITYLHWQNNKSDIDVEAETQRLSEMVADWDEYFIFAKSAGTWVVMNAVRKGLIEPEGVIFTGTAVNLARQEKIIPIDDYLNEWPIPTLFIQKSKDPAIWHDDLRDLLEERNVQRYFTFEVNGTDHNYPNIQQLGILITDFAQVD